LPPEERWLLLAKKYSAAYLVVDRLVDPGPTQFPRVYPVGDDFNTSYAVYRLVE
jgi:hypothetical protein